MSLELHSKRQKLVDLLLEVAINKLENKYFIFEVETFNPNTEIGEEWFSIYQIKNKKLEFKYSPSDKAEYESLDSSASIDLVSKYLKRNKISEIYSLAGISYYKDLFGLDMTETYEDEELGIDSYKINPIFHQNDCVVIGLNIKNIPVKIPFLTQKSLTKYI
jgi:hypothetical protein